MRLPIPDVLQSSRTSPSQSLLRKMETSGALNGNSSMTTPAYFGLTEPISMAGPKPFDLKLTKELEETLRPHGCFESDEEMNHRMAVLGKLDGLVKKWIYDLSLQKNIPPAIAEQVGGKIYAYGSYRLGVHNRGADIDALCVVPRHIDRSDYFTSFVEILKDQPETTDLRAIEDAFVPVVKMKFDGIEIDMVFARLAEKEVTDDMDLTDDRLLKNLDQKCVRSLNGCRVTDEILRQVPNTEAFRLALRGVKLWAKKNGVYSNVLGYLGGVAWAMLVARACQLYPNATGGTVLSKFFMIFVGWNWPAPVLLKPMLGSDVLQFPVWDPRQNPADRYHLMPIITPAYPQQNSTFNTSVSTRDVMLAAFKRAQLICEEIVMGKATWDKLFEPFPFFQQYKHFIVLVASSNSQEDQLDWYGMVESKIRHLIVSLERNEFIQITHIWPTSYPAVNPEPGRVSTQWFIGLQFVKSKDLNVDLTVDILTFTQNVMKHASSLNLHKDGMELNAQYVRQRNLTDYLPQEIIGAPLKRTSEGKRKRSSTTIAADAKKVKKQNGDDITFNNTLSL